MSLFLAGWYASLSFYAIYEKLRWVALLSLSLMGCFLWVHFA